MKGAGGKAALRGCREFPQRSANAMLVLGWQRGLVVNPAYQSVQLETHSTCSKAHSHISNPGIRDVLSTREEQSNSLWAQG